MDVAMCTDLECPSKMKCYRFLALPDPVNQAYCDTKRKPSEAKCAYFIPANCCETSIREWGPGNYRGEVADCLFCNHPYQWTGLAWKPAP